ncbi:protein O-GlcNAcase [Latimeria chalumnae]|uniref:protein O-GlcNAcase n=1 Tax=Latimeria chalumnae TaxID=7897 RepID=UPI0006D9181F|nr:PREDICTED: protein O-GlcNAcase-like [Latimeria chalumnae]|eukprot:XP_005998729.2 PREDICTED: protein O-GlcNAcase-like [Latimeria chalumnae]
MEKASEFICGVVEGFYGRPWSMEQRKELFRWLQKWDLNTYMYGPKDDLKHRLLWRETYSDQEAALLKSLVQAAQNCGVEFVYAISPGHDIIFSSTGDVELLKRKVKQVVDLGCKSFAVLFDDIDHSMCHADKEAFSSFAHAQVSVANEIYQYLGEPAVFLFCPTEYCNSLCYPCLTKSYYLKTVGEELLPGIRVIWTGTKVVPRDVSVESLEAVEDVLKRSPVIWDNLHANDYDSRRVFLGPYKGRPSSLIPKLQGVLLNPNCEFEANFIPLHSLATWFKSGRKARNQKKDREAEHNGCLTEPDDTVCEAETSYSPQEALNMALQEWMKEINKPFLPGRQVLQSKMATFETTSSSVPNSNLDVRVTNPGTDSVSPQCNKTSPLRVESEDMASPADQWAFRAATKTKEDDPDTRTPNEFHSKHQKDSRTGEEAQPLCDLQKDSRKDDLASPITEYENKEGYKLLKAVDDIQPDKEIGATILEDTQKVSNAKEGYGIGVVSTGPPSPDSNTETSMCEDEELSKKVDQLTNEKRISECPTAQESGGRGSSERSGDNSEGKRLGLAQQRMLPGFLTEADIRTLVELYYLPYDHGEEADNLLREFRWLNDNRDYVSASAKKSEGQKSVEWRSRAQKFCCQCEKIAILHGRFVTCVNRALFYDLYPYIWDMRNILLNASAFIAWLDGRIVSDIASFGSWANCFQWCRTNSSPIFLTVDAEPWIYRGGLSGEFQVMLPVGNHNELFNHPPPLLPVSTVYTVRPFLHKDKVCLYQLCRDSIAGGLETAELIRTHPDLIGDRLLGSFLTLSPEYCFILETEEALCGYAAGALNVKTFLKKCETSWYPTVREKYPRPPAATSLTLTQGAMMFFHTEKLAFPESLLYHFPSLIQLDVLPHVSDPSVGRSLAVCLLSALKANGSQGVFCEVSPTDKRRIDFYSRLGFLEIPTMELPVRESLILARLL